jgi:hypothetical protein
MRVANQVVAILYSLFFALLLLGSFALLPAVPYDPFVILFLAIPVVLNWLSYGAWANTHSRIRQFDFVIAIIYALFFAAVLVASLMRNEYGALLGIVIFSPPVVMNYLSYSYWPAAT